MPTLDWLDYLVCVGIIGWCLFTSWLLTHKDRLNMVRPSTDIGHQIKLRLQFLREAKRHGLTGKKRIARYVLARSRGYTEFNALMVAER